MKIDGKIKHEKQQNDSDRAAAKISALSSRKIGKYEFFFWWNNITFWAMNNQMKLIGVRPSSYFNFDVKNNDNKNVKLKVGDHLRILKYKNTFAKG